MTDMPRAGFLCAGKTPIELSVSIHCASKMMKLIREFGFMTGGCYTDILDQNSAEKIARAGKTLEHLCMSNELVISVGCEGFSSGDTIPDITDVICPKKAAYFANILCGSQKVTLPDGVLPPSTRSSRALHLYPDDAGHACQGKSKSSSVHAAVGGDSEHTQDTLAKRIEKVLGKICSDSENKHRCNFAKLGEDEDKPSRITYGSIMKIFSSRQRDDSKYAGQTQNNQENVNINEHSIQSQASYLRGNKSDAPSTSQFSGLKISYGSYSSERANEYAAPLSRASAGIIGKSLLLNFSNDVSSAPVLLQSLIHAINFSVYNLSGKSAFASMEFENSLKSSSDFQNIPPKKHAVND